MIHNNILYLTFIYCTYVLPVLALLAMKIEAVTVGPANQRAQPRFPGRRIHFCFPSSRSKPSPSNQLSSKIPGMTPPMLHLAIILWYFSQTGYRWSPILREINGRKSGWNDADRCYSLRYAKHSLTGVSVPHTRIAWRYIALHCLINYHCT